MVEDGSEKQPNGKLAGEPGRSSGAPNPPEVPKPQSAAPPEQKPATAAPSPSEKAPAGSAAAAVPPKPAAAAPAKPATPAKPAAPPLPKPEPLDNELVQRLKARFGAAIREATLDRKQAIVLVVVARLRDISEYCRDEEKFNFLTDLTAVDWPKRPQRFDIILNLYSFPKNERLRLKAYAAQEENVPSVCDVWPAANWLEREAYDMFGIIFEGHPDLKRILMPDEWEGHPLRKDYDILKQDTNWVRQNLGIESGQ